MGCKGHSHCPCFVVCADWEQRTERWAGGAELQREAEADQVAEGQVRVLIRSPWRWHWLRESMQLFTEQSLLGPDAAALTGEDAGAGRSGAGDSPCTSTAVPP